MTERFIAPAGNGLSARGLVTLRAKLELGRRVRRGVIKELGHSRSLRAHILGKASTTRPRREEATDILDLLRAGRNNGTPASQE